MRCAAEIGVPPEVKERVRRRLLDVLTADRASACQLESLVAESLLENGYLLPKSTVADLASELSDELFGMGQN